MAVERKESQTIEVPNTCNTVRIGLIVTIRFKGRAREEKYHILDLRLKRSPDELVRLKAANTLLSSEAALANAIIGKIVGETATYGKEKDTYTVTILSIEKPS